MPHTEQAKQLGYDTIEQLVSLLHDTKNLAAIEKLKDILFDGRVNLRDRTKKESTAGKIIYGLANTHFKKSEVTIKKNTQAENHPRKGQVMKVHPIKKLKDIIAIKRLLAGNPRDNAIFTIGINTALRGSDLARLRVGNVRGVEIGEHFTLREKKTQKLREVTVNKPIYEAVQTLLCRMPEAKDSDYLFPSQKGKGPLTTSYLNQLVKEWCRQVKLKENVGSHSLRKTWGYHARVTYGMDLASLVDCFGHSTQKQTLTYLCIQQEEVRKAFMNEL
jgi:integrase